MNLGAVMQEVADRLDTIPNLRVYGYPPDSVTAPAAIVTYPSTYSYDETYHRGMDRMDLQVVLLLGKVSARSTRDVVSKYVSGSGPESVKAVVESGEYTEFDTVRVSGAEFDIIGMGSVEYMAATLTLDITGTGA